MNPVDVRDYVERLILENPNLVRAKGFLRRKDGTMMTLQVTGRRIERGNARTRRANPGLVTISLAARD